MAAPPPDDPRRALPAVDRLLAEPEFTALEGVYGRERVRVQLRARLEVERAQRASSAAAPAEPLVAARLAEEVGRALAAELGAPLARVINATGIFLHTNLGRAPLPRQVARRLPELADAGCDLELDLASGRRGDRLERLSALIAAATAAEAGLAVNNNAAALVLILAALAQGREVVVSRGELVEIGGSFRVPEILEAAGARLVEVGTTNRTHLGDYEKAIGSETALLLKVLPSNFRQRGFTAEVAVGELARLGRAAAVPLVVDEGSGLLAPRLERELAGHPSIRELIGAGADLVTGSGDKLLGGPQAGLVAGRRDLIDRCRRHPLYRALRPGRLIAAALDLVLRRQLAGAGMPLDRLWIDPAAHRVRLERLVAQLAAAGVGGVEVVAAEAFTGGGSGPDQPIAGEALALAERGELARRLRLGEPAVVGYVRDRRLILDLRTVDPQDDEALAGAVAAAARS
ncbi:MAG: L-seryl-tRNA(Sec) selenium transferase [Acidobacteriota bacterium]